MKPILFKSRPTVESLGALPVTCSKRGKRAAPLDHDLRPGATVRPSVARKAKLGVVLVCAGLDKKGSYEERVYVRCLEGFVYDGQRGAWVECGTCSGTGQAVVYVYPKLKRRLQ